MKISFRPFLLAAVAFCMCAAGRGADTRYGLAADNAIAAQRLVNRLIAQEPKLLTAGMHCIAVSRTLPPDRLTAADEIVAGIDRAVIDRILAASVDDD